MPDVITSWGPSWAVARRFAGAAFVVDQRYWSDSRGVDGLDTAGEYARADRAGSRCGAVGDAHLHSCSRRFVDGSNDTASSARDRKSTRLNSSHVATSYAVFC